MKDMFETCERAELCKAECPTCDNEMCNGLKGICANDKPCGCWKGIERSNNE